MKCVLNPSRPRLWRITYEVDERESAPVDIEANYWQQALEFYWAGLDVEAFNNLPQDIEIDQGGANSGILSLWVNEGNGNWGLFKVQDITPNGDDYVSCDNVVKQRLTKDERRRKRKG